MGVAVEEDVHVAAVVGAVLEDREQPRLRGAVVQHQGAPQQTPVPSRHGRHGKERGGTPGRRRRSVLVG